MTSWGGLEEEGWERNLDWDERRIWMGWRLGD